MVWHTTFGGFEPTGSSAVWAPGDSATGKYWTRERKCGALVAVWLGVNLEGMRRARHPIL